MIALTGLILASCGGGPGAQQQHRVVYQYRCCADDFQQQAYAPGQALSLHWMSHKGWGETTANTRYAVLSAKLTGPYAQRASCSPWDSPACLKGMDSPRRSIAAPTLRADTWNPESPVSTITLSTHVAPGLYLLGFLSIAGSLSTGASEVVRVG